MQESIGFLPMLRLTCLLLLALPFLAGPAAAPADGGIPTLASAQNEFAFDLYQGLRNKGAKPDNLFFSPYSVWSALLMAREGARGKTAVEMDALLRTKDVARGSAWKHLKGLLKPPSFQDGYGKEAKTRPAYELNIANAVWGQALHPFKVKFTVALADEYGAPLERADFTDEPAARKLINDWVEKQTKDKIKDIVPEGVLTPQTRMVLANAIYFKAAWQDKFEERWTKPGDFEGPDGKTQSVLYMHRRGVYARGALDGVQALELPYRKGATSMWVLVPEEGQTLGALEDKLDPAFLSRIGQTLKREELKLYLPKWKFTTAREISEVLKGLGMPLAFSPSKADFSGITDDERLFIGAALHKAFVAVDEEGTEAAAATVLVMKGTAFNPKEPPTFRVDRPFVFVIRHKETGAVLFMGRVTKPTAAETK